jgi:hypothetical protein
VDDVFAGRVPGAVAACTARSRRIFLLTLLVGVRGSSLTK